MASNIVARQEVSTGVDDSMFSRQDWMEDGRVRRKTVGLNCIYLDARGLTGKSVNSRHGQVHVTGM